MVPTRRRLLEAAAASIPLASSGCAGSLLPREKWRFETESCIIGHPIISNSTLIFGNLPGFVFAVDLDSGEQQWQFETDGEITSWPAVAEGTVYVTSEDENVLYALATTDGAEQWRISLAGSIVSSPLVNGDRIFVSSDQRVYALDVTTGEKVWAFDAGPANIIQSTPILSGETLFVGSAGGSLFAIDAGAGRELWEFQTAEMIMDSSAVVGAGTVYIGSDQLYAIDISNGTEVWRTDLGGIIRGSSPILEDGNLFVGAWNGAVHKVDTATGEQLGQFKTTQKVRSTPTITDEMLYVSSTGMVFGFDRDSMEKRWSYQTGVPMLTKPVVVSDSVIVGGCNGVLYALRR